MGQCFPLPPREKHLDKNKWTNTRRGGPVDEDFGSHPSDDLHVDGG
ncbi:hypothetical protein Pla52o_48020 [Novipirellula galeiformis]|uniref:Uncharacterized protein n=1 Tax=Novipirellula galeiformis TaxID=2528004 RepID=A0A5C6CA57_9BACT|nr:hypothetical protein Pla52o_48020 [Novipirellula galeiformis]